MLVKISTDRTRSANFLMIMFAIVIVIGGLASEFFQAPLIQNTALSRYQLLLKPEQIDQIESIQLDNRLGLFKINKDKDGQWTLTSPRNLPSSTATVASILQNLKDIKIRQILPKDAINISNFSLDSPLMKLQITYFGGKEDLLNIGLVNPIDNSTYVTFSSKDAIYHVDALENSMEGLSLSNFIEPKVFTQDLKTIAEFKIYRGKIPSTSLRLSIKNETDGWLDNSGNILEPKAVEEFLTEVLSLKSSLILDKKTDKLIDAVSRYFANPSYTVEILDRNGKKVFYEISYLINNLPDIKMEKRQVFIVKASNRPHPYVIEKQFLSTFGKSQKSFKKLSIKKLFY
ncbi:DUF4340 domain-containing protein [Halobacteriovorax sp. JY17]|uniref:DUF4340 domain-containing protein n=1 Tax=Halobacteriovorax sp. JY17 TaxID=2014617 RepID=UPI000C654CBC|nr:DUF4340 domain-containing protein [Halobacteriovorax sp. JY17]PIK13735.1 MAG: hypothetical protein CES88_16220 [Halobacteriovorax sp. JY17]